MVCLRLGLACLAAVASSTVLGCGGGDPSPAADKSGSVELLPDGGSVPPQRATDLGRAAEAAGCELARSTVDAREHTADLSERVDYRTNPPTSGRHYQVPAEDGRYEEAPADTAVVHALEHGRVAVWLDPRLPRRDRAAVRALFDEDSYQLLVVPRPKMPYAIAASAWNAEPEPLGTGRLITCRRFSDSAIDALRTFRDEHRSRGPEPIP